MGKRFGPKVERVTKNFGELYEGHPRKRRLQSVSVKDSELEILRATKCPPSGPVYSFLHLGSLRRQSGTSSS